MEITQSGFDQVNRQQETISKNHEASIKSLEMQIGQLSRQVGSIPSSNGGFMGNIIDNPKNDTCKAIELEKEIKIYERRPSLLRKEAIINEIKEVD